MKRIIAALQGKIEKIKLERKINRVNRAIESGIDNAKDAIDKIEEEKAQLMANLSESMEVNDIIIKIADKIECVEEQEAIIKRLEKVRDYINEEVELEESEE